VARDKRVLRNYKDFLEEAEKITGKKIKATTGGTSKNHRLSATNQGALDIGKNANKLTKDQYNKVGDLAIRHGFRLGDEKNHLHVDNRIDNTSRVFLGKEDNFKQAPESNRFIKEHKRNIEAKSQMFDNRVLPQQDSINKQDSSILKEEEMAQDLRRPASEDEEKPIDEKRQEFNSKAIQNTPAGQHMSQVQQRKVMKEQANPENQMRNSAETQRKKASGEQISTKDNFMEAITFFLPSIVGGVVGHAIGGGEGAAQGVQLGMKGAADFRSAKLAREKFEHAKQADQGDALARERLEVTKGNLELRKQEVAEQRKRTGNLEEDRSLRREERNLNRQIQAKESFGKRGDVKKLQEQGLLLKDMDNILTSAPEIASGVIGFKIAKGIAGEVGNLTQAEREDAQISPSFYRKMVRGGTKFLMGTLPEQDTKELVKVVKILEKKRKGQMRGVIEGFSTSRKYGDMFTKDLYNEHGVEEKKTEGKSRMTPAQKSRLEELRKKHR
jgi:hypothetical protein